MILPIVAIGDSVLRDVAEPIASDYPGLEKLIADMFETMYNAHGVGLAAPQIGRSIRLFVMDSTPMFEEDERRGLTEKELKQVFINPVILDETGEYWEFEEGCLSIPGIREPVLRHREVLLRWQDESWTVHEERFTDIRARIIQHEHDHLEGVLFTDYAPALRKRLLRPRQQRIARGQVNVDYPMRFARAKVPA